MATESGEGWRRDFGIFFMVLMSLSAVVGAGLVLWRRNHSPLNIRPWRLLLASVVGGLCMLEVPIREVIGEENFPCDAYLWMVSFFVPSFATPVVVGAFRVSFLCDLEEKKNRYADGDTTLSAEMIRELYKTRSRYTNVFALIGVLIVLIPFAGVILFLYMTSDDFGIGKMGCELPQSAVVAFVFFALGFASICLKAWLVLRHKKESYGLKDEFIFTFSSCFGVLVIWFFVKLVFSEQEEEGGHQFGYLVAIVPVLYNIFSVIRPALATFKRQQAVPEDANFKLDFEEFLSIDEGFQSFKVHLQREFAAENLLFWRAVCDFEDSPSKSKALSIYETYLTEEAFLQVNISAKAKEPILAAKGKGWEDPSPTMFREAKNEVLHLMERDSLPRFLQSKLWKNFNVGFRERNSSSMSRLTKNQTRTRHDSSASSGVDSKSFLVDNSFV